MSAHGSAARPTPGASRSASPVSRAAARSERAGLWVVEIEIMPRCGAVARITPEGRQAASPRPRFLFQFLRTGATNGASPRRASSSKPPNRSRSAAIMIWPARPAPSSALTARPSPLSGRAAQRTPSAPPFVKTRPPRSVMISVSNLPVPPTMNGFAATAARIRTAALARSGESPCPVPKRANACASACRGIA